MADWRKNLNKAQKKHLREMGVRTKSQFVQNRTFQQKLMSEYTGSLCPETVVGCWDCREVAKRLGVCQDA